MTGLPGSVEWYERALRVMPGGVNSPVRAFRAVGGAPPFVVSASGARVTTADGDVLIDVISSWGALIFGHADPTITDAIVGAARSGTSYGVPSVVEVELAELICELVPSVEVVRMVNSGTEATASALRVARAVTGRDAVVKFAGCYHGHADPFLVRAGSGAATFGLPDGPGVPEAAVSDTRIARFNDLRSVTEAIAPGDVAAVIVEPVAGNMGVVPPEEGFLDGLRSLCDHAGALLIFDEVMTGFRLGPGGAQELYEVTPDLTCLGKIVGGGAPAAAYGGRRELMDMVAPSGPVYQAGTLAGNALAVAAGLACLRQLANDPGIYGRLEHLGSEIESALSKSMRRHRVPGCVQRVGSMLTIFFGPDSVKSWDDAERADKDTFARFFQEVYRRGVLLPPSQYEALFLNESHEALMAELIDALTSAIEEIS